MDAHTSWRPDPREGTLYNASLWFRVKLVEVAAAVLRAGFRFLLWVGRPGGSTESVLEMAGVDTELLRARRSLGAAH